MTCFDGERLIYMAPNKEAYMCLAQNRKCGSEKDGFCGYAMGLEEFFKTIREEKRQGELIEVIDIRPPAIEVTKFHGEVDDLVYSLDRYILRPKEFRDIGIRLMIKGVVSLDNEALLYQVGPEYYGGDSTPTITKGRLEGKINEHFELKFSAVQNKK